MYTVRDQTVRFAYHRCVKCGHLRPALYKAYKTLLKDDNAMFAETSFNTRHSTKLTAESRNYTEFVNDKQEGTILGWREDDLTK
jgi:hypothetical protein